MFVRSRGVWFGFMLMFCSAKSRKLASSEIQGQIVEGKSKRAEKYGTKKSKKRREDPLGTMSYQTSSKRSPPFWLLIGARKTQVFKFPFFTFLRAIFFRPFRLSLAPTICPWVFEDGKLVIWRRRLTSYFKLIFIYEQWLVITAS